jgi:hypothetical protein
MKYVPSLMVGQLSASAGSTTASRNRFGSYFRNRVMPVNPQSESQTVYRLRFQDLSSNWRDLSDEQRQGWAELGSEMVRQDSLGQTYNLTGLQAFTSLNLNRFLIGSALLEDAPAINTPPDDWDMSLVVETDPGVSTTVTITSDLTLAAGEFVVIEATPAVSPGITFVGRSQFKVIDVLSNAAWGSPENVGAAYAAVFGLPPVGDKVFVQMSVITAEGFRSTRRKAFDVVEAPPG